ncbi:MAG TPA: hypothetical protein VKI99_11300 [Candidatus Dormibacteraeota bacterium]|nr:hypothetical protein [Candidatus Dormibacteraeota bacterium]
MGRFLGLALAALLAVGVVAAIGYSLYPRISGSAPQGLHTVRGVIGSEKQPFFQDPEVVAAFHKHGLDVQVDTAGSREIATTVDLTRYDFAFPSGVPAADKIKRDHKARATYTPFYTPMAVGSFQPIAKLLQSAGVVRDAGGWYTIDMKAYLDLVAKNTRWSDLPNNTAYPAAKSVLITSTDVRTSNSAAMYLSMASYVANGNNVVQDDATASKVVAQVAPLFLRQGFTASSSEEPFRDYLSIGVGKTPMVMIYEAQYLSAATARDKTLTPDMTLMYPSPTVLSKHIVVPLDSGGDQVGRLLTEDQQLQQLAVKYGFRTSNAGAFTNYLKSRGAAQPPQLVDVIDPPAFEPLETMIQAIQQLYKGS